MQERTPATAGTPRTRPLTSHRSTETARLERLEGPLEECVTPHTRLWGGSAVRDVFQEGAFAKSPRTPTKKPAVLSARERRPAGQVSSLVHDHRKASIFACNPKQTRNMDSTLVKSSLTETKTQEACVQEEAAFVATMGRKIRDRKQYDHEPVFSQDPDAKCDPSKHRNSILPASAADADFCQPEGQTRWKGPRSGLKAPEGGNRTAVAQILCPQDSDPPIPSKLHWMDKKEGSSGFVEGKGKAQFSDGPSQQAIDFIIRQNQQNFRFCGAARQVRPSPRNLSRCSGAGTRSSLIHPVHVENGQKPFKWHVERRHAAALLKGDGVNQALNKDAFAHQAECERAKRSQSEKHFKDLCSFTLQSKEDLFNSSQTIKSMMNTVTMEDALQWP